MLPYLLLMAVFAAAAVLMPQRRPHPVAWAFAYIVLVLFVGLRHKVGMDWNNYLYMIQYAGTGTLGEAMQYAEPAYAFLLWASGHLGVGMYGVNLVAAAITLYGVFRFARSTAQPWLALVAAMPVLIVVVSMSANRQAVAIGILLWLASSWDAFSLRRRIVFVLAAAMFHFSAIFFLMFVALGLRIRGEYKIVLGVVMVAATIAFLQLSGSAEYYDQAYVSGQSDITYSTGATQHVLLNGIPALLLFLGARVRAALFPTALHVQMAWLALALVPLAIFFSAAAGRMTLYLFPVAMHVFAGLPGLLDRPEVRAAARTAIAGVQATVLYIWLAYANSSIAHNPYANALMIEPWERHLCCS